MAAADESVVVAVVVKVVPPSSLDRPCGVCSAH